MKPHFYYKCTADSEVGQALNAFVDKCNEASETARQWAERQGASTYYESPEGMSGGISALEFPELAAHPADSPEGNKEGWERVDSYRRCILFYPKEGSDLEKEMNDLPIVSETELINILHFKPAYNKLGNKIPFTFGTSTPLLFLHHDFWYVEVPYECEAEFVWRISEKEFLRRKMAHINEQE